MSEQEINKRRELALSELNSNLYEYNKDWKKSNRLYVSGIAIALLVLYVISHI